MTIKQTASALIAEGIVFTPRSVHNIPQALIDDANEASQGLIKIYAPMGKEFSLTRLGEYPGEPDMMFPASDVANGKDMKSKIHYSHDLLIHPRFIDRESCMTTRERAYWEIIGTLYDGLNRFTGELMLELYGSNPELFTIDIAKEFRQSLEESIPYSTTILRGLWYPPQERAHVAKPHFDRSLLTNHLGDQGGKLQAHFSDDRVEDISPERGEIATFWGVKVLFATDGVITPIKHGAIASNEEDRKALVHFAHAEVGYEVRDAKEAHDHFWRQKML